MKSNRKIKISRKYSYTKNNPSQPQINPKIVLQGEWLRQAGFATGQSVSIEIFEKMLIVTLK